MQRENTEFLKKKQGKLCNPNTTSRDLGRIYSIWSHMKVKVGEFFLAHSIIA